MYYIFWCIVPAPTRQPMPFVVVVVVAALRSHLTFCRAQNATENTMVIRKWHNGTERRRGKFIDNRISYAACDSSHVYSGIQTNAECRNKQKRKIMTKKKRETSGMDEPILEKKRKRLRTLNVRLC